MVKPKANIHQKLCLSCGGCISVCPQQAIEMVAGKAVIDKTSCNSCGICLKTCPIAAIHWEGNT